MRMILLGPPGSGKGTQAARIVEAFRVAHLSTGEMLRAEVGASTEIGRQAKAIMGQGGLVPDDLILVVEEERISKPDCRSGFVLDGFPRTISQAEALDKYLEEKNLELDHVIELKVAEEILLERVMSRVQQAKRSGQAVRADDNRDALKLRLDAYNQETAPLIEYYQSKRILTSIDGLQAIDVVIKDVLRALED
jgi:adenylate kinase